MQSTEGPPPQGTQFERLYADPSLSGQPQMWLNSRERRKFRSWYNQTHARGSFDEWLERGLRVRDDEDFRFDWIEGYFTQRKYEDAAKLINEYVRQTTATNDLEVAVRKEVMSCRKSGIRFNAHKVANNLAAQGIKATVSAVRKLRNKIEQELGPVQPLYRERARPTRARPVVAPGHESIVAPTDDRPVITPYRMIDYASGTVTKAPSSDVVLEASDYDQLCDAFMDDDDYEQHNEIDLALCAQDRGADQGRQTGTLPGL